jgi:adenine-specific DNA-methyltransferase
MIDTDYDEESFFMPHVYFLGADPYDQLKKALKAEIDPEVWGSLNSATSRPFVHSSTEKIAVKVVNHYGDELLTVLDLSSTPGG